MKKEAIFFSIRMPLPLKERILDYIKKQQKIDIEFSVSKFLRAAIQEYLNNHS